MRRTITRETWEQIFTGYAAGVGLREIARRMKIPEGTVQAHSKRHGWTRQIQSATRHPAMLQPNATDPLQAPQPASLAQPVQSVPQSVAAILSERKERSKLALSKYAAEASEAAGKHPDKLSIAGKVKDIAGVHKALWPEESGEPLIEGSILVGLAVVTENQEEIRAARGKEISEELLSPVIDIEPNEEVSDAQSSVRQLPDDSPECNQSESSPAFEASAEARENAGETSRRAYRERCTNWRRNAR